VFIKSWKRKKVDPSVPGENEKSSKTFLMFHLLFILLSYQKLMAMAIPESNSFGNKLNERIT
jgi:hypothetical protein